MNNESETYHGDKAWPAALTALLFCLAWVLFWYRGAAEGMVGIWARSDTFMHGFLILPIVLWLIWRQRKELAQIAPRPNLWMLILLGGAGFAWLLGELAAVNAITQLALVMLMVLVVPALLGLTLARAIAFPLAFLFFAVPIGEFFMPQLMEWTAHFTVLALRMTGIPVYQEGLQFVIPSGSWSVVEACSGVRYLIASLTVGTLFAYLNYVSIKRRLIFIAVSFLVPILANWMRAYVIVMLGHLSSGKLAAGVDHLIYGWVFFGLVIMIMFMIGARWSEYPSADIPADAAPSNAAGGAGGKALWLSAVAIAAVTAIPSLAVSILERSDAAGPPQLVFPLASEVGNGAWQLAVKPVSEWRPAFINPSAELQVTFLHEGRTVGLYLGYYRNQDYTRKLVSSENMLVKYRDPLWAQVANGTREIVFEHGPIVVRTAELRGSSVLTGADETRLVVWQWYWVNGRQTASDHEAKAYIALSRLLGTGDDSAVIIIYAPKDLPGGGEAALATFVEAQGGAIEAALLQVRGKR